MEFATALDLQRTFHRNVFRWSEAEDLLWGKENRRSLHCAPPDFLWTLVALSNFMGPSLRKGPHAALSSAA
jgi:hypothetical protein